MPVYPHNLAYTVHIESPASDEELAELQEAVERVCPVLNLLRSPQDISGYDRAARARSRWRRTK